MVRQRRTLLPSSVSWSSTGSEFCNVLPGRQTALKPWQRNINPYAFNFISITLRKGYIFVQLTFITSPQLSLSLSLLSASFSRCTFPNSLFVNSCYMVTAGNQPTSECVSAVDRYAPSYSHCLPIAMSCPHIMALWATHAVKVHL